MDHPAIDLLKTLVARRSVTPDDAGCQDVVAERLAPLGFRIERLRFGNVHNLWARRGTSGPLLCFAGHTDVVPPGPLEAWHSDPFVPTVRDGKLYGRGAADMKGSIAAFVTAVEDFAAQQPAAPGCVALLLTSDEEGIAVDGTVKVVQELKRRSETVDYCIVGEPTSAAALGDTLKNGRRGSLSGTLTVKGVQGHVAYPHLARNPIHQAAPAIAELAGVEWDRGNEHFPPTTFQISNIRAGTGVTNVIPGQVTLQFNWRFSTASTVESLKARLAQVLERHALDYDIAWEEPHNRPYLTAPGPLADALAAAVREVTGVHAQLSTTGGTSDGRFIAEICPQVIELGPLNATIHKVDECIDLADVPRLAAIYGLAMRRLLA
ncbi:MAG: succinyl-diaminopimelate desuccinylase [Pseudomonadota bacterium]